MMTPAPVAALTTPLYRLATSARLRCRPAGPPSNGAFWLLLLLLAAAVVALLLLLLAALPPVEQDKGVGGYKGVLGGQGLTGSSRLPNQTC
jgi:hypothetical protein